MKFSREEKEFARNVVGIFLETQLRELYLGAPLFPEIHSLLTNQGFRLIFCEYNADLGGEIVEFDVAYVRKLIYYSTAIARRNQMSAIREENYWFKIMK